MNSRVIEKFQRFGGAMYTPVLLFTFPGLIIGITAILNNAQIMGPIAAEGTLWNQAWYMVREGAQTVFRQMPLIFTLALPIGLCKKQPVRCALESLVTYITFQYFLSAALTNWGPVFGIDFANMNPGDMGVTTVASIKTLDTSIAGSLIISGIVVWLDRKSVV